MSFLIIFLLLRSVCLISPLSILRIVPSILHGGCPGVYAFDEFSVAELGFQKFIRSSDVLFSYLFFHACFVDGVRFQYAQVRVVFFLIKNSDFSWFFSSIPSIIWLVTYEEKIWRQLHKNAVSTVKQVLEAAPHKAVAVRPLTTHLENYSSQTNQICGALLEKWGQTQKQCTPVDEQKQEDKVEPTYNSSALIQDVALEICRKRRTIKTSGGRGSGKSVLAQGHDDDYLVGCLGFMAYQPL